MIEIKTQYPYVTEDGVIRYDLIKHYAEDSDGVKYRIKQVETDIEYDEAVDIFPCKYTYKTTEKKVGPNNPVVDNDGIDD